MCWMWLLHGLLNMSLSSGCVPEYPKMACVQPLIKNLASIHQNAAVTDQFQNYLFLSSGFLHSSFRKWSLWSSLKHWGKKKKADKLCSLEQHIAFLRIVILVNVPFVSCEHLNATFDKSWPQNRDWQRGCVCLGTAFKWYSDLTNRNFQILFLIVTMPH